MKKFVNDQRVIGKWKKLAVVKDKNDFNKNKFDVYDIFNFEELYFLPNGEEYWVFGWSKGVLYVKDRQFPYEIIDNNLFIGIVDSKTNTVENYAVYQKVDDKEYNREEIKIKDNTNIPFINDEKVIGCWETIDFVNTFDQFKINKKYWQGDIFLTKYIFENGGKLYVGYKDNVNLFPLTWSKGVVINKNLSTVSDYKIKNIDEEEIMFVEWKSGDYTFGGKVHGYYVLKKIK